MNIEESIIDLDIIKEYEKDTNKEWGIDEEAMAEICSHYDYGFSWNKKGNIVINNHYYDGLWEDIDIDIYKFFGKNFKKQINGEILKHYEYDSAKDMVNKWKKIIKKDKESLINSYTDGRFKWL